MDKKKVFLGFDFYGAGNVGDDLMLSGFLRAVKKHAKDEVEFFCFLPRERLGSQRKRFPEIAWKRNYGIFRSRMLKRCACWLGVGDTPFQLASGSWLLDHILKDVSRSERARKPMYMIGVGAEREVEAAGDKVLKILGGMEHLWVRDKFSGDFLGGIGVEAGISIGSDLAHIALREIFFEKQGPDPRRHGLAVNYYLEKSDEQEFLAVADFLRSESKAKSIVLIGNETRKEGGFEYEFFKKMFPRGKDPSGGFLVDYFSPDYENAATGELVGHFRGYKTVIASRYHALLAAAWAGCEVAALDRSSKIRELADEMGVPLVGRPLKRADLSRGLASAKRVPRRTLEKLAERADDSVRDLMGRIMSGS